MVYDGLSRPSLILDGLERPSYLRRSTSSVSLISSSSFRG